MDHLVLATVSDLLLVFRVDPDGDLTSVTVSGSWARAAGGREDDWLGRSPRELLPSRSADAVVGAAGGGRSSIVFDDAVSTPDRARPVEVTVTSAEADDVRYVLWAGRDVADQRRDEQDMRWVQDDLRRSNSDLAEFATVASHDLKEPLRMITAYLELLDRRYGEVLDERGHQYLGFALDGAVRLRAMTDALLHYAKVRTDPMHVGPVDLADVAAVVQRELAMALHEAGADLTVGRLPVVHGSESLLQMLLQNLVSNAIKFSTGQPRIEVSGAAEDDRWVLTVDDDGIGVPVERRQDAFAMFRRLHARSAFPGNGMGLALCRGIVDAHGGDIGLHDSPLGGTRVRVGLPRTPTHEDLA